MMSEAVIADCDGTIASALWRGELAKLKQWDAFHRGIAFDSSIPAVCDEVESHANYGHAVILVTARTDRWRLSTVEWLHKHHIPWDELHMRVTGDHSRRGSEIKREIFDNHIRGRYKVVACYEDHPKIVPMWSEVLGFEVPCLKDPGIEPHDPEAAYAWLERELQKVSA